MFGYVRLVSDRGTIKKIVFNNEKVRDDAYNECLRQKTLWEESAPQMFPDGLKIIVDK